MISFNLRLILGDILQFVQNFKFQKVIWLIIITDIFFFWILFFLFLKTPTIFLFLIFLPDIIEIFTVENRLKIVYKFVINVIYLLIPLDSMFY